MINKQQCNCSARVETERINTTYVQYKAVSWFLALVAVACFASLLVFYSHNRQVVNIYYKILMIYTAISTGKTSYYFIILIFFYIFHKIETYFLMLL